MAGMERHRGHFYNWYDTRSLKPLLPLYVSTVDSGNLAGLLLVLRGGLLELPDTKLLRSCTFAGPCDTARVLLDVAKGKDEGGRMKDESSFRTRLSADVVQQIEQMVKNLEHPPDTFSAAATFLQRLVTTSAEIVPPLVWTKS